MKVFAWACFFHSLGYKPKSKSAESHGNLIFLTSWETTKPFPKRQSQFAFPAAVCESFSFLGSSPNLFTACLLIASYFSVCEVGPHCGFNLHFPCDQGWWAYCHVLTAYLTIFTGEIIVQVLCPLLSDLPVFFLLSRKRGFSVCFGFCIFWIQVL